MISAIDHLGSLWRFKRGAKEEGEFIPSFVHLESLRESIEMRFQALDEASLGAPFYRDSQQA